MTCVTVDTVARVRICAARAAPGGACNALVPCAVGHVCVGASASMMRDGTCQAQATTEGAPCDPRLREGPDCRPELGLVCDPTTLSCQRRVLVEIGQVCGTLDDGASVTCQDGATCERPLDPPTMTRPRTGVCIARAAAGSACDVQDGPNCVPNHVCEVDPGNATAGTCKPRDYLACLAR
jgi:hypothetical protein